MGIKFEQMKLGLILYLFWLVLTMNIELINLLVGGVLCIIITIISYRLLFSNYGVTFKIPSVFRLLRFLIRLLIEIYLSSFTYIIKIIKKDCDPVFVDIDLNTDNQLIITMIANAITLTPGTLTVDADQNHLVVLSIDDPQKKGKDLAKEIKQKYERIFNNKR